MTYTISIWQFPGAFTVVKRQSECGSITANYLNHDSIRLKDSSDFRVSVFI